MVQEPAVCPGHRLKRTPPPRAPLRWYPVTWRRTRGQIHLLKNKFNTASTAKLRRQHRLARPGPVESPSGANLATFPRFPRHLIPSGRANVRLFSLFSVIRRAAAGNQLLSPCLAPRLRGSPLRLPPVFLTATLEPPGAAADAAEPPTTSGVERRSDGSFETCFAFFFLPVFFFFLLRDLGRLELGADQSDSPRVVASEAPRPRPRSSSECVTGPEAPPPAAVQTAGIKIKLKRRI